MVEKNEARVPATAAADPFQAFRSELDKLAESFFGRRSLAPWPPTWGWTAEGVVMPSIDLKEDDKAVVLTAELPGMAETDVELSFKNGVLTIKGEKAHSYEDEKDDVQVMERRYGSVQRSIRVPESVDADRITAGFENGVLTVTMPKRADVAPPTRKITING